MRIELEQESTEEIKKSPVRSDEEETESLRDEIKLQQEKVKSMPRKDKITYFVYYYKWHVIIGLILLVLFGTILHSLLTRREDGFYCVLMNVDHPMVVMDEMSDSFEKYAGMDQKKYKAYFDTSISTEGENPMFAEDAYDSVTRLNALFIGAQVDVVCGSLENLMEYDAEGNMLMELSELLSEENIEALDTEGLIVRSKSGNPIGIKMSGSEVLVENGCYDEDTEVYACVMSNAPHVEFFDDFVEFMKL